MNANSLPPIDSPAERHADREYRAFFSAVVPNPFPPLELPKSPEPVRARPRRTRLALSRIVLAVCVSALLVALWVLKQPVNDRPSPAVPDGIEAQRIKDGLGNPM